MAKDRNALIDTRAHALIDAHRDNIDEAKSSRPAPMAPAVFHELLKRGVEARRRQRQIYERADVDVMAKIYASTFLTEMTSAWHLNYYYLAWGDDKIITLAAALAYAHAQGGLQKLEWLELHTNAFGDAGLAAIMRVCALEGAMPNLKKLYLDHDQWRKSPANMCMGQPSPTRR